MADIDQLLEEATSQVDQAEGYITDAEFREDFEEKQIRYQQAISHLLLAVYRQNLAIIDLMRGREEA